jgi:hypothetical protein
MLASAAANDAEFHESMLAASNGSAVGPRP